jgi:hypothetical protein
MSIRLSQTINSSALTNLIDNSQFCVWSNGTENSIDVGSNLISNGGFDSTTTGWTAYNADIASVAGGQSGNCLQITVNPAGYGSYSYQVLTCTIGKKYKLQCYVKSGTAGNVAGQVQVAQTAGNTTVSFTSSASWVLITCVFVATQINPTLWIGRTSTNSGTILYDTVTCYLDSELITNPNFDLGDANWTKNTGWTIVDQGSGDYQAVATSAGSGQAIYQSVTTTIGKLYKVSCTISTYTSGSHQFYIGGAITPDYSTIAFVQNATTGTFTYVFRAESTSHNVGVMAPIGSNFTGKISEISCKELIIGCTASNTISCDGWAKNTGADIYREEDSTNIKYGAQYALKYYTEIAGHEVSWPKVNNSKSHLQKFRGKTVTFGFWIKSNQTANNKLKLWIHDGLNYYKYYSGSGNWEWLELTHTISTSATAVSFGFWDDDALKTAYICCPMLVFGDKIGYGNYSPIYNEIIMLDKTVSIVSLTNRTLSDTTLPVNMESCTRGKIGRGIIAAYVLLRARDSGSAAGTTAGPYMGFSDSNIDAMYCEMAGKTNGAYESVSGIVPVSSLGILTSASINASGTNTLITSFCSTFGVIFK